MGGGFRCFSRSRLVDITTDLHAFPLNAKIALHSKDLPILTASRLNNDANPDAAIPFLFHVVDIFFAIPNNQLMSRPSLERLLFF
jgi:hypothetical protein